MYKISFKYNNVTLNEVQSGCTHFDQHSFLLSVQAVESVILMLPLWSASPFSLVLENPQTQ